MDKLIFLTTLMVFASVRMQTNFNDFDLEDLVSNGNLSGAEINALIGGNIGQNQYGDEWTKNV